MKLHLHPARLDGLMPRDAPERYFAFLRCGQSVGGFRPAAWRFDAATIEQADADALAFVRELRDACDELLRAVVEETP